MKNTVFSPFMLGCCLAAAMLAGCAGTQPSVTPGAPPLAKTFGAHGTKDTLLYVSDEGTSDVYVYSLSKESLVQTLTGFSEPRGVCLNTTGDIWITEAGSSSLVEYAPGGSEPIGSLSDPGEYPVDCSVNAKNGDLGVSNIISANNGPGSLSIYTDAGGTPSVVPAFGHTYSDAYDSAGNLFVVGVTTDGLFQFGEVVRGANTVTNLEVAGARRIEPTNLQFAHGHLTMGNAGGDPNTSVIYQLSVSGATATVVGRTLLHDAYVTAYFITGDRVFCLVSPRYRTPHIAVFKYPEGGKAIQVIKIPEFSIPTGLAVVPAS